VAASRTACYSWMSLHRLQRSREKIITGTEVTNERVNSWWSNGHIHLTVSATDINNKWCHAHQDWRTTCCSIYGVCSMRSDVSVVCLSVCLSVDFTEWHSAYVIRPWACWSLTSPPPQPDYLLIDDSYRTVLFAKFPPPTAAILVAFH